MANKVRRWAGTLLSRQHELTNKRGMVPRHLLLICCLDDIGAHSPQHDTDVYAGIGEMCRRAAVNGLFLPSPSNATFFGCVAYTIIVPIPPWIEASPIPTAADRIPRERAKFALGGCCGNRQGRRGSRVAAFQLL